MANPELPALPFQQFIKKAEQLNAPKSILIYGDPKNGKTWLAASASEVYKLFSEDDKLIHSLIIKKELT